MRLKICPKPPQRGYITKLVAKGVLAKVHLTLNEYAECAA
jgi:hypothetical protein